jgi:cytochrome c
MQVKAARWALLGVVAVCAACNRTDNQESVARGLALVEENCSRCHAIGREGLSPLPAAPPFRQLHERYPVEDLAEALAEGIVTGHPAMPQFVLDPTQIEDVIAYLKTLETTTPSN